MPRYRGVVAVVGLLMLSWTSVEFSETTRSPVEEASSRVAAISPTSASRSRGPVPTAQGVTTQYQALTSTAVAADALDAVAAVDSEAPLLDEQPNDAQQQIDNPPMLDALLTQAHRQWKVKRWTRPAGDNALETYRLALELDPDNSTAQRGLAKLRQAFLRQATAAVSHGDYSAGRVNYEKVLLVDPDYAPARIELARLEDGQSTVTPASRQSKPANPTVALAVLRGKMQTFLASAEGEVRNFLKNVQFEGGRNSDVPRPDR